MPTSYLPYEPNQDLLLPHSLCEWLPEDHLAHFVSETIDALDLGAFYARYESGGARNQPFHPTVMVKVLVYAYATGVFSSRKIAKKLQFLALSWPSAPVFAQAMSALRPP